ncbi:hypothetical protein DL93DRAFT_2079221 [Clavulina sp. PMI_390]|nr:hypothetical protein DL93DRAFT_2079221 [Clavulina sp. PMI_390]
MPSARWNTGDMQVFERIRGTVHPASSIISVVSLGIRATVALGGSQVSHVQRKTRVLVDECLLRDTKVPPLSRPDTLAYIDTKVPDITPIHKSPVPPSPDPIPIPSVLTSPLIRRRTAKELWGTLADRSTGLLSRMSNTIHRQFPRVARDRTPEPLLTPKPNYMMAFVASVAMRIRSLIPTRS